MGPYGRRTDSIDRQASETHTCIDNNEYGGESSGLSESESGAPGTVLSSPSHSVSSVSRFGGAGSLRTSPRGLEREEVLSPSYR